MDFANTQVADYGRFELKWGHALALAWRGGAQNFEETQHAVREIWDGKRQGHEHQLVSAALGLMGDHSDYYGSSLTLLKVDWKAGNLWLAPRDINEYVWLSLLQYSTRLAVCPNREDGCPAPFFIKHKPNQKFCSEVCALPAQREFKRQWFREHGDEWRQKWLKKRGRQKRSSSGRNN